MSTVIKAGKRLSASQASVSASVNPSALKAVIQMISFGAKVTMSAPDETGSVHGQIVAPRDEPGIMFDLGAAQKLAALMKQDPEAVLELTPLAGGKMAFVWMPG